MITKKCWYCGKETPHRYCGVTKKDRWFGEDEVGLPMYCCIKCKSGGFVVHLDKAPDFVKKDLQDAGWKPETKTPITTQTNLEDFA